MTDSATSDAAIHAALIKNWIEAVRLNKLILSEDETNIDALNRLGFAYLNIGKGKEAKQTFTRVLKLDPYNRIATNNLKKVHTVKQHHCPHAKATTPLSPLLFLEEPGKTKCVDCVNVASQQVLATLTAGEELIFKFKKHSIDVRTLQGTYIGALPDDIAFRLIKYTSGGNEYVVHIKRITKACVSLFIREVKRGKRYEHQSSFAGSTSYIPYTKTIEHEKDIPKDAPEEKEE